MILKMTLAITGVNVLFGVCVFLACRKWGSKLKIDPPRLVDAMIVGTVQEQIGGRWYEAKPLDPLSFRSLVRRINHAYLIIIGKAQAHQYMIDRTPKDRR